MPRARRTQVCLEATPFYHCISRCVRHAYLCGDDPATGRRFEHRKVWIVNRLRVLAETFAVDVCAFAVMSNHLHLVLRVDTETASEWSDAEVIERWGRLFSITPRIGAYQAGHAANPAEDAAARTMIAEWRARLADLSWFMRCLNEPIARWANAEDGCTGRFWEGRFKCQALLDEPALLACMAYVDLNPVRACVAETPEDSYFTSIHARIRDWQAARSADADAVATSVPCSGAPAPQLLPFSGERALPAASGHLPFDFLDYLQLLDWTGRAVRQDKPGAIPPDVPPIFSRLTIDPDAFVGYMRRPKTPFAKVMGRVHSLQKAAILLGQRFLKGIGTASQLFPEPSG